MQTQAIAGADLRFPTKLTGENLDAALLFVMVNKIITSDAQLWDRVSDAKNLIEKNNVIRGVRAALLEMKNTQSGEVATKTVPVSLTLNSPLFHDIKAALPPDGPGLTQADLSGPAAQGSIDRDIPIRFLLSALGQRGATIPTHADDADGRAKRIEEIRGALAEQLSSTESQQSQVLLQDALQKSRELVSMSGGLIKTRHDAKMGILQKY